MTEERERSPRNGTDPDIPNRRHYKCYAIGVAYSGEGYLGFQFQPGDTPTVEKDFQTALITAGFIHSSMVSDERNRQLLYWSRAARTDKGVHACMNIISCRMDSLAIPHKQEELDQEKFVEKLNTYLPSQIRALFINRVTMRFDSRINCDRRRYEYYIPKNIGDRTVEIDGLRQQFEKYKGTHNFHNFTKGMKMDDKSAFRHIASVDVVEHDSDTVVVRLVGQSFLLNQIRKMVSLTLEVSLGLAPNDAIEHALTSRQLTHIHMVPGEGLLLDKLYYKAYDTHKCGDCKVTTPFFWLISDEHEEGGDSFVLDQVDEFKKMLVNEKILPGLKKLFDFWFNEVVIPNDWVLRHRPVENALDS